MPWYKSGTVYVTQNSNAVIGTGTAFIANSRVGDAFRGPDGGWYEVTNIASDTALSINPTYKGTTITGGSYALAPMQGYVKDSADALRALVTQYGVKLAALGTTGNYETLPIGKGGTGGTDQAGARTGLGLGSVSTENTVPVAKGGTGGTDQAGARTGLGLGSVSTENTVPVAKGGTGGTSQAAARTGLGLKTAAIADVLGATTQSGGVVTGALFNSGSNANGFYTFMADGTLICTHRQYVSLGLPNLSGAWYYNLATWIFPVAFIAAPKTFVNSWCAGRVVSAGRSNEPTSVTTTSFFIIASENVPASTFVHEWMAIGRWF